VAKTELQSAGAAEWRRFCFEARNATADERRFAGTPPAENITQIGQPAIRRCE
jgi:hypothetical protein